MVHNGPLLHVGGETMNIEEALENLDQLEDESIYRDDSCEYAENQEIIAHIEDLKEELHKVGDEVGYEEEIPGLAGISREDMKSNARIEEVKRSAEQLREREQKAQQQDVKKEMGEVIAASIVEVEIYQLSSDAPWRFQDLQAGQKIDFDQYESVWKGAIEQKSQSIDAQLENIYEKFNCNRPKDFKGHSLSVSDIVAVDRQLYYCKDIGFEKMKLVKGKENNVLVSAAQQEKQRPKKRSLRVELSNGKGCERERGLEKS